MVARSESDQSSKDPTVIPETGRSGQTGQPEPPVVVPTGAEIGSAFETLKIAEFRRVFLASFASSLGRWMQNVALGAFTFTLTGSASFTTFIIFAQLFPLLTLSVVGGSLADSMDRRVLLTVTQAWQALWGLFLAYQVLDEDISRPLLVFIVFMIGIGQALFAPAFTAIVPSLVGPRNLPAAISLNSMQINGSRVIGPVVGAVLINVIGLSGVFVLNSLTYILIIGVLLTITIPPLPESKLSRTDRLLGGIRLARRSSQVGTPLMVMTTFSLFCLPFIGLMPVLAEESWSIDVESTTYGLLYGTFGLGALGGAICAGTFLLRLPKELVVRSTLGLFAVALGALSFVHQAVLAFPILFFVGLFYFTMPTALSTFLQEHLANEVRGRVMALWVISFGGVLSITNLFSGFIVEQTSLDAVLLGGAIVAMGLAITVRLKPSAPVGADLLETP